MTINWRQRATVFQLLAATYAELGEEAFKGRYLSIARYFGPDATYDSIKSFFAKEVSRAAEQLKAKNPDHQGSGRRALPRPSSSSRLARPPHLYFDDEDLSILTQREAEAHFGHTLRAPAKRPRVMKASPVSEEPEALVYCGTTPIHPDTEHMANGDTSIEPVNNRTSFEEPVVAGPSSNLESASYVTAQSQQPVSESRGKGNKRAFAEVNGTLENHAVPSLGPATPSIPRPESFGFVTNQGNYRCALCLSQLPSQEDLDRHEVLSNEHLRNLNNAFKVSKGREKLAQVTAISNGRRPSTPVPTQLLGTNGAEPRHALQLQPPLMNGGGGPSATHESSPHTMADQDNVEPPLDTIEVHRRSPSIPAPAATQAHEGVAPAPRVDKGKGRANSIMSEEPQSHTISQSPARPSLPTSTSTRPTSARTEIGTITPPQANGTRSTSSKPGGPMFSPTDVADIMRNTEMMIRLLSCVQREAISVAGVNGTSKTINNTGSGMDFRTTPAAVPSLDLGGSPNGYCSTGGVNGGGSGEEGRRDDPAKIKDTGDGVLFICLDD